MVFRVQHGFFGDVQRRSVCPAFPPKRGTAAQVPRPAYIPPELHGSAQYVEISYEGMGTARVWRIPRDSLGDMPESDLDEPG